MIDCPPANAAPVTRSWRPCASSRSAGPVTWRTSTGVGGAIRRARLTHSGNVTLENSDFSLLLNPPVSKLFAWSVRHAVQGGT